MKIFVRVLTVIMLVSQLNGCGTMYSLTCKDKFQYADSSAGRIYGGVRVDVNGEGVIKDFADFGNFIMLPIFAIDKSIEPAKTDKVTILHVLDFPLSLALDTAALIYTVPEAIIWNAGKDKEKEEIDHDRIEDEKTISSSL